MLPYRSYKIGVWLDLGDCKTDLVTTAETDIQAFLYCFWGIEQVYGGGRHSRFGQARRYASS